METLVTMGFNNGVMVENLRYRYKINAGWLPIKGLPFSVRSIVNLATHNIYFFREDSIVKKPYFVSPKLKLYTRQ